MLGYVSITGSRSFHFLNFQVPSQGSNLPCSLSSVFYTSVYTEMKHGQRGACLGDQSIRAPQLTTAVKRNCSFRCSGICPSFSICLIHSTLKHSTKELYQGLKYFCRIWDSWQHLFHGFLDIAGHNLERGWPKPWRTWHKSRSDIRAGNTWKCS